MASDKQLNDYEVERERMDRRGKPYLVIRRRDLNGHRQALDPAIKKDGI